MSAPFKPITPGAYLSDQVADVMAAKIRAGRLAAGDKLPTEAVLVDQFSVSRTVVREALSRLKSLGLVESRQGSGVFVKEIGFSPLNFDAKSTVSKQAVIQMVEVRRALEAEVAALAAQRRTKVDIKHIHKSIADLEKAVLAGGDGVNEDVQFHRAIADAARNPFLIGTLEYLGQFLRGATRVTRANEARRTDFARQVREEHAVIVKAIEAGDAEAARKVATLHMNNAIARIEHADPAFWQQTGVQLASPLVHGLPA
ncbi:MAG: FadR/GntR family transcriptional regulator [Rhodoferax sp.]|uniref:FadR/GntR family transcriptional regulator n=1 Tax=Rhodoferax sp. TaxID=50421 RepID=UPI0027310D25|nr:FadR/GntR family transcriptional regulator [Rhodoferax sp.]MDP1531907.1 FadR/GntR family transcriptional regulator [Rhodoferax sp.]MDP1945822.1 FadR/GntR family transcriptional regulator [Rhodoferax sp.]